jgi:hypothetical protein
MPQGYSGPKKRKQPLLDWRRFAMAQRLEKFKIRRLDDDGNYSWFEFDFTGYSWVRDQMEATPLYGIQSAQQALRAAKELETPETVCYAIVPCQ